MTTEAAPAAADTAPLSLDAAVGLLDHVSVGALELGDADQIEEKQPAEATEPTEAEPTADGETDPDEPVIDLDTEDEPDPAAPAIAAPQSWDAEERAVFATLPPEAQQVIAARDKETSAAVNRAQNEASEARKRAETEVQSVTNLKAATEQVLTQVQQTFKGKWDNVDWAAWAQSDPAAYVAGKAAFDAEQAQLARLEAAHQEQTAVAMRAFVATKMERIKTEAPDLIDPVKGPERVARLEQRLVDAGIPRDVFHTLDAFTIGLANDGFKYRDALARAKAKTPPPVQQRAAVRPAAARVAPSPQRAAEASRNRFAQTGSIDDAVAVMNARQSSNGRSN